MGKLHMIIWMKDFLNIFKVSVRMGMYHRCQSVFYKCQDQRNITAAHVEHLIKQSQVRQNLFC